jgi:hypothetical protein
MILEIKGPLLAMLLGIFIFPIVPFTHMFLMQVFKNKQHPLGFLICSCLIYGLVWLISYINFSGIFSPTIGEEILAGISTVAFLSLGYGEVFSMICRGFSLRILIDILINGPFTMDQVVLSYGEGKGVDWMIKKRITGIESLGLVKWENDQLKLNSNRALFLGKFGLWFKQKLKLGLGG